MIGRFSSLESPIYDENRLKSVIFRTLAAHPGVSPVNWVS